MNLHTAKIIIEENIEAIGGVDNYRDYDAINYSTLKALSSNPKSVGVKLEGAHLVFGSLVDDLLTQPDTVDDNYHIGNIDPPTGQMLDYVMCRFDGASEKESYDRVGFKRDSFEKVKRRFETEGKDYYNFLMETKNKDVVSLKDYNLALMMRDAVQNHTNSNWIFEDKPNVSIYYQVPLLTVINGNAVKVLIDILIVDEENKIITPIDLKTTSGGIQDFSYNARKYRYDLQGSLYSYVVSEVFPGYSIEPFLFLVVSKYNPETPVIFRLSLNDIYTGRFGGTSKLGIPFKGWDKLISEYVWHKNNDYWDLPKEYTEEIIELSIN